MSGGESGASRARFAATLGLSAAAILALSLVAPLAPFDSHASFGGALAAYAFAFASVSAMTLAAGWAAPLLSPRAVALALGGAVALLAIVSVFAIQGAFGAALVAIALLGAGSLLGALIGARIEHPGHLSVVALVSSVFDVVSVFSASGPSAQLAQSETWLAIVALSFPMVGSDAIEPLLGVGDVVFVALYFAAARAHALPPGRTLIALALALVLVAFTVVTAGRAIPALPMLGAAIWIAHPAARLPPEADRTRAAIALVALFALLALALGLRSAM